jgi:hypothetical protein
LLWVKPSLLACCVEKAWGWGGACEYATVARVVLSRRGIGGWRANMPLDSQLAQPPHLDVGARRGVALQVAFERQILKPFFHLIGLRVWV